MPLVLRLASLIVVVALTDAANAAEPVRVLAAFTLKPALDAIAEDYRHAGGAKASLTALGLHADIALKIARMDNPQRRPEMPVIEETRPSRR